MPDLEQAATLLDAANCCHTEILPDQAKMQNFVHTRSKNLATNTNDLEILDLILGGKGIIQLNWGFYDGGEGAGKGCRVRALSGEP